MGPEKLLGSKDGKQAWEVGEAGMSKTEDGTRHSL